MENKYLTPDEYMPYAPTALGEQVHVFHCREGKDNDRLYIKREYDGSVVAYCHHCHKSGVHGGSSTTPIHVLKNNSDPADGTPTEPYVPLLKLPVGASADWKDWPIEVINWVTKYHITQEETHRYGIMAVNFGSTGGYVILPVYNEAGVLNHYQRRFFGAAGDGRPKYDTVHRRKGTAGKTTARSRAKGGTKQTLFRAWFPDASDTVRTNTIAIVEDVLSAIRCGRHCDAVALSTAHLPDENLKELVQEYDNFVIFLDNDNPAVCKEQLRLKRRLDMLANGVVQLVRSDRDPKEHTDEELEILLWHSVVLGDD